MYEVTYINPWIPARYAGIVTAAIGLIPGGIGFLVNLNRLAFDELVEGLGYIIIPLAIGVGVFLVVGFTLMIYNKTTDQYGGIHLDLEFIEEKDSE